MKLNDFRFMWRGKDLEALTPEQSYLLAPVNTRKDKKETALLLLHGYASTPAVFREILPAMTHYDALVCPVLPGHAESIATFSKSRAKDWLLAAEHVCASLIQEYQKVDIMGLSMGGLIACHLSTKFSLHHLYLLAPALALIVNLPAALALAKVMQHLGFRQLRNHSGNLHTKRAKELSYRQVPIISIIEILSLIRNFSFTPPNCPTDVFLGCYDEVVDSFAVAKYFANLSNVNIHWLLNSAHVLPLDGDVNTIISCVNHNWRIENKNNE